MNQPAISIQDFTYHLPEEKIALHPLSDRDQSKLLVYREKKIIHSDFKRLAEFLPANSILFFNNTKVIPARLLFKKETGAVIEIFLLNPVWPSPVVALAMNAKEKCRWVCTIGNLKRWPEGSALKIIDGDISLEAKLVDRKNNLVEFQWSHNLSFAEIVKKIGAIPLPPYIKRNVEAGDRERYQTVYSKEDGAVAAPTAGLHFTKAILDALKVHGIAVDYLTLHVSAGTFQPVKVENAADHPMHSEQIVITRRNIKSLLVEKKIVAVGTTSLRTLESMYWYGAKLTKNPDAEFVITQDEPYRLEHVDKTEALKAILAKMDREKTDQLLGETSIYIMPGYDFKVGDVLITNFHQPGSTLILLVAAFVGNDWKRIYDEALANRYRFLSYGDSSLLFKKQSY